MKRKVTLLAALAAAGLAVLRRVRGRREERDLWAEATNAPDLR